MRPETPVYKVTQLTGLNGRGEPFGGPDHGKWSVFRLLAYHTQAEAETALERIKEG